MEDHSILIHKTNKSNYQIAIWLLSGAFLIFLMVVVGGITRLTGSGLSITEWKPIMGAVPPLNDEQWQEAFQKYQQIPQFQKLNYDFTISDFKEIFFWEYLHRLIGRLIGVVFIGGFLYFFAKNKLTNDLLRKTLFLFLLGALQGFIGWYMVSSGLVERTSVSQYRLAIHLITAFITFGVTLWFALELLYPNKKTSISSSFISALKILLFLVTIQIIYGAFSAGLHAGKVANTFPTMNGEWIPSGINAISPWYKNLFENLLTVQFIHRMLASLILIFIISLWGRTRQANLYSLQKTSLNFCFLAVIIQFLLGVFTLIYAVPIVLAVLHQVGGFILFSSVIIAIYSFSRANQLELANNPQTEAITN